MKTFLITVPAAFLALGLLTGNAACADSDQYAPADEAEQANDAPFTAAELDDLLAPIALYPDPLLAQILPAATFSDQIDAAARYMRQYGPAARIDAQPWDVSVKAVAHYSDLLAMMDQKLDWTVSLGQAYINQQQDVMDAIQRLRAEAAAKGNLNSTPQQQVVDSDGFISIDPVAPDVIYVPQYDPQMVYMEPGYGYFTFGTGFIIGAWLNRDCDWHGRRIYYHGWQGGGWIGRSRLHVRGGNSIYINNRYRTITVNRGALHHDTTRFRGEIRRNVQNRPALPGRPAPSARVGQGAPAVSRTRQPALPASTNVYRGRDVQRSQPASQTGYGGYGSSRDAATYRQRGQTSRGAMQPVSRPAATYSAPAQRAVSRPAPSRGGGGGGGGGRQQR
jgi:hypothetical protein